MNMGKPVDNNLMLHRVIDGAAVPTGVALPVMQYMDATNSILTAIASLITIGWVAYRWYDDVRSKKRSN